MISGGKQTSALRSTKSLPAMLTGFRAAGKFGKPRKAHPVAGVRPTGAGANTASTRERAGVKPYTGQSYRTQPATGVRVGNERPVAASYARAAGSPRSANPVTGVRSATKGHSAPTGFTKGAGVD